MKAFKSLSVIAFLWIAFFLVGASSARAAQGLVIHASEFGVGKFHRMDNKVHEYPAGGAWNGYILPEGTPTKQAYVMKNADSSYTVFFSTLDELIKSVIEIAKSENAKVSVLNLHGHGLPGRMWFPKDERTMKGWQCMEWQEAASGSDKANYNQYYRPVSADQVRQMRDISNNPNVELSCTTGLKEWQEAVGKTPEFKALFASDAQIHFLSCIVGLGTVGEVFTKGMAALLLEGGTGRIETSVNFGLGDWSMPLGMGFWDYITDDQVKRDGEIYSANKKDAEIAQKGTIRVARYAGSWTTSLRTDVDFMSLKFEAGLAGQEVPAALAPMFEPISSGASLPTRVRIPGTNFYTNVLQR